MALCKTAISPLLLQWRYCILGLSQWYILNSLHHLFITILLLNTVWKTEDKLWFKCVDIVRIDDIHDDVIKWKYFPRQWPFVRGIHQLLMNSLYKCQWRGALRFSLICPGIIGWVNNGEAGDLRCHRTHYDVTVMCAQRALFMVLF